jgi:acyl-[acyl carrier protein]--UDP-N-acetylglucosamine O-acyltransferase
MGNVFSEKPLKEVIRENQRLIKKSIRELEKEIRTLETNKKKLEADIRKHAKIGQMVTFCSSKCPSRFNNYFSSNRELSK